MSIIGKIQSLGKNTTESRPINTLLDLSGLGLLTAAAGVGIGLWAGLLAGGLSALLLSWRNDE